MAENVARCGCNWKGPLRPSTWKWKMRASFIGVMRAGEKAGGTHFRVRVVSTRFLGVSRLERHRLVHAALADFPRRVGACPCDRGPGLQERTVRGSGPGGRATVRRVDAQRNSEAENVVE